MGNLFHKKETSQPSSRVTDQDRAILQFKQIRDKLKQYQKRIEIQIEKERLIAKELVQKGKKDKALLLLKKKKYLENNLNTADKQLFNLEEMFSNLEYKQIETQVVSGLKMGNECLKNLNKLLNIDEIERIMDETKESIDYQQQINELLSGQLSEQDEEEIENELNKIVNIEYPKVPTHEIQVNVDSISNKRLEKKEIRRDAILAD